MSVLYCEYCHEYIDTDFNEEHYTSDGECVNEIIGKLKDEDLENWEIKELEQKLDTSKGRDTELFGRNSVLDSLALVNLIVAVEENISDEFEKDITITSEKAMSRNVSPFKNVGTLIDYILELLSE